MKASTNTCTELRQIPLSQLRIAEYNVRHSEPADTERAELADSIRERGLIHPLGVVKVAEEHYEVITGSRRLQALRDIAADSNSKASPLVPCMMYPSAAEALDQLLISAQENVHRKDLSQEEWRIVIDKLKKMGQSQEQIARLLHKSPAWVSEVARGKPLHAPRSEGKHREKETKPETFTSPCCGKRLLRVGRAKYKLVQTTIEEPSAPAITDTLEARDAEIATEEVMQSVEGVN